MEFCERCGSVITIQEDRAMCAACGHKSKKKPKIEASESMAKKEAVAVVDEKVSTYPIVQIECHKCKNKKAYFWTLQTRAGDESETKFYKCTKCSHTWRVYR